MGHRIAYSASGQINRKEFGLSFNVMLDGRFVVSDKIQIMIEGELVEQQPAEATPTNSEGHAQTDGATAGRPRRIRARTRRDLWGGEACDGDSA
jgi:hypothetical protein